MRVSIESLLVLSSLMLSAMSAPTPAPAPDSALEDRGLADPADLAALIGTVVTFIETGIAQDKMKRSEYTKNLVNEMRNRNSSFNYIACHTKHTYDFAGTRGVDWSHQHQELDVKIGGTIGYEIYNFKAGTFHLLGDGGYLNWAYDGNVSSDDEKDPHKDKENGRTVVFNAP